MYWLTSRCLSLSAVVAIGSASWIQSHTHTEIIESNNCRAHFDHTWRMIYVTNFAKDVSLSTADLSVDD